MQQISEPPAPVEAQTAPEAAILPAEATVEPVEANYPVEQEVVQESSKSSPESIVAEEPVTAKAIAPAPTASDAQQEAPAATSDAPSIGETVKRIIIEINGSGSIDVGGMNEESVLDILTRHAKPVLMSIIKGEIFEEGDLAYDF